MSIPCGSGTWIETYPQCDNNVIITDAVQVLQICWCIICACQTFFFASRWPVVSSELVLVPAVESLVYGLGYANVGYLQLYDGRFVCWARHGSWLITCPMILFQVSQLSHVRWSGIDMNPLMVIVCQVMLVFGFSASVSSSVGLKWMFFSFGVICMTLVFGIAFIIFRNASRRFLDRGTFEAKKISERIQILALCFFLSWSSYPVLYILSGEGACVASERVIVVLYIVADGFAKNVFGLVFWETSWNHLKGTWASDFITGFTFPDDSVEDKPAPASFEVAMSNRNIRDVTADLKMQERANEYRMQERGNESRFQELSVDNREMDRPSESRQMARTSPLRIPENSDKMPTQRFKMMTGITTSPKEPFPGYYQAAQEAEIELASHTRTPSNIFPPTTQISPSQKIEDVVDHVRSLNQALCELLANEAGRKKPDQAADVNGTYGMLPQNESLGSGQDRGSRTSMTFMSPISSNAMGSRTGRTGSASLTRLPARN